MKLQRLNLVLHFNYSKTAFDGAVERIRILEDGSRHKNIRITGLAELSHEKSEQTRT